MKGVKEKSKTFFSRFSLYNPLYRFDFPEQPKMAELGPDFCFGMLILIHIMGKHHVHLDFLQKVFFDTP